MDAELYAFSAKCAVFCLDHNELKDGTVLSLQGQIQEKIRLRWEALSSLTKDMYLDEHAATEYGAYCIAFLIVKNFTNYKIVKRSVRGTGIDFYLSDKKDEQYPFKDVARLEVSGILKGSNSISRRVQQKKEQTKKSVSSMLPAFVSITEFSTPISHYEEV